jgi:hypothetical protein
VGYTDNRELFWANERGIELKLFTEKTLNLPDNRGWYGYRGKEYRRFIANRGDKVDLVDQQVFVYKYNGFIPASGVLIGKLFRYPDFMRNPRYDGEPPLGSFPIVNKTVEDKKVQFDVSDMSADNAALIFDGKNIIQIKDMLDSDIAEEYYTNFYPIEDYENLYKGGRKAGKISEERPDGVAIPYSF